MTPSWSLYIFSPKNLGKIFRGRNLIIMVFGFPQSDQKVLQNLLLYFLFFLKAIRFRTLHSRLTFTEKKNCRWTLHQTSNRSDSQSWFLANKARFSWCNCRLDYSKWFVSIYLDIPQFLSHIYFSLREPTYVDYSFLYLRLTGRGQQAKPEALPFDSQNRCL